MQRNRFRKFLVPGVLISMIWLLTSCLYILGVIQPSTADVNEQITVTIDVEMDETGCNCPGGGPSAGLVAMLIPTDWTVDDIEYDGDYGPELMSWLDPDSNDIQPGAGTDFWYDSLTTNFPPPAGMDWVVYQGDVVHGWIGTDTTNTTVTINMTTGAAGQYDIGYYVSTTDYTFGNPDETDFSLGNSITVGPVGIEDRQLSGVAENFTLAQNYPNPFNPSTSIRYSLQKSSSVKLTVYDIHGQEVAVLTRGVKPAGNYEVTFDAENLVSGVYLYRMEAGSFVETRKMMLVR